ncbi:hypothetical protein BJ742DRAFT_778534 [Cladochytrium replicatum]|nr:hypothetical protein BJ742DRAFT_778534 [Cladochytrium replicatum]
MQQHSTVRVARSDHVVFFKATLYRVSSRVPDDHHHTLNGSEIPTWWSRPTISTTGAPPPLGLGVTTTQTPSVRMVSMTSDASRIRFRTAVNERHIVLPSNFSLLQVHVVLQLIHGMDDAPSHMHRFFRPTQEELEGLVSAANGNMHHNAEKKYVQFRAQPKSAPVLANGDRGKKRAMEDETGDNSEDKMERSDEVSYQIIDKLNSAERMLTQYAPGCFIAHTYPKHLPTNAWLGDELDLNEFSTLYHVRDERVFQLKHVLTRTSPYLLYEFGEPQADSKWMVLIELKDVVPSKPEWEGPRCMAAKHASAVDFENARWRNWADERMNSTTDDKVDIEGINRRLDEVHQHAVVNSQSSMTPSISSMASDADTGYLSPTSYKSLGRRNSMTSIRSERSNPDKNRYNHTLSSFPENTTPTFEQPTNAFTSFFQFGAPSTPTAAPNTPSADPFGVSSFFNMSTPARTPTPPRDNTVSNPIHAVQLKCYMCRRYRAECTSDPYEPCHSVLRGTPNAEKVIHHSSTHRVLSQPPKTGEDVQTVAKPLALDTCCEFCLFVDRGSVDSIVDTESQQPSSTQKQSWWPSSPSVDTPPRKLRNAASSPVLGTSFAALGFFGLSSPKPPSPTKGATVVSGMVTTASPHADHDTSSADKREKRLEELYRAEKRSILAQRRKMWTAAANVRAPPSKRRHHNNGEKRWTAVERESYVFVTGSEYSDSDAMEGTTSPETETESRHSPNFAYARRRRERQFSPTTAMDEDEDEIPDVSWMVGTMS